MASVVPDVHRHLGGHRSGPIDVHGAHRQREPGPEPDLVCDVGQPDSSVTPCSAPTGLDSGEPRWRRYTLNTAMEPMARNSDCQFCSVRFQKSADTRYSPQETGSPK